MALLILQLPWAGSDAHISAAWPSSILAGRAAGWQIRAGHLQACYRGSPQRFWGRTDCCFS